jgi:dephospho-CoA kinase
VRHFAESTSDKLVPPKEGDENRGGGPPLYRAALGRRVFGSSAETKRDRAVLDSIVHPAVRREIYKALLYYYVRGYWTVVLDIPLLLKSGLDLLCETVAVVM